jgi:DNA excision repair protein ERCC-2
MADRIFFPHDDIRPIQDELIQLVESGLKSKKRVIVHAPTGLGKTAATLAPAVSFAAKNDSVSVFFLTSRHTQHKIVLDTLRQMKEKFGLDFIATSIIGKKYMCLQPNVDQLGSNDFSEYCKALRDKDECEYYINSRDKSGVACSATLEGLKRISPVPVEELVERCRKESLCPYDMALSLSIESKVIVSDYNYLFNPSIREIFFKKIGKSLSDSIIIVDEGHNLPSRLREQLTRKLSDRVLKRAIKESKKYQLDDASVLLTGLEAILCDLSESMKIDTERLVEREEFIGRVSCLGEYSAVVAQLKAAADVVREQQRISTISWVAGFLEAWPSGDDGFCRILSKDSSVISLTYRCLDPALASKEVIDGSLSTIIMSGTLSPAVMYRDLLGFPKDSLSKELPSPFPKNNMLAMVVPKTTTQYSKRCPEQYQNISNVCAEIMDAIPGNAAIFFPSYSLKRDIGRTLGTGCKKIIFDEQQGMSKEEKQEFLSRFCKYDNAVLLGVASGSFGEGIDLPGILKCVVVVGLPLGHPDLESDALIKYYDKKFGRGQEYGYVMPALTKTMQNAGRCIRSETDRGVLIFLDERYKWPNYFRYFPSHWNLKIGLDYIDRIKDFFGSKNNKV